MFPAGSATRRKSAWRCASELCSSFVLGSTAIESEDLCIGSC